MPTDLHVDSSPPPAWRVGVMHTAYLRIAIHLIEQRRLFTDMRVPQIARMVPLLDLIPVLKTLQAREKPLEGLELALMIPAAAHGAMGYAAVSSATIGQAMETIARFAPMRNRVFDYRFKATRDETVLSLTPAIPLQDYLSFFEVVTVISLVKMVQDIAGELAAKKMQFDATWARGPDLPIEMKIRYSQQTLALHVPSDIAAMPVATADARLYASACRSCEEELAALNGSLSARMRALMPDTHQVWPSLKDFAERFAMSPRTLIRKLEIEGCSYQSILDEAKSEMAIWYLCNTTLSISVIAERLGFMDDTNFSRSFRRWRGMKPLEYRKSQQIASTD